MIKGLRFLLARFRRRAYSFASHLCACLFVLTLAMTAGVAAAGAEAIAEGLAGDPRDFAKQKVEEAAAEGRQLTREEFEGAWRQHIERAADIARLSMAGGALLAKQDPIIAADVAGTALDHNFIPLVIAGAYLMTAEGMLLFGGGALVTVAVGTMCYQNQKKAEAAAGESESYGSSSSSSMDAHDGSVTQTPGFAPEAPGAQTLETPVADVKSGDRGYEALPRQVWPKDQGFAAYDGPNLSILQSTSRKGKERDDGGEGVRAVEKKQLLPGEGRVEDYGVLDRKFSVPGDNLAAHHIPHDNYMKSRGIKKNDGVAIMVEQPTPGVGGRHREIHRKLPKLDTGLEPRDALAQSVKRAQQVYKQDGLYQDIRPSLKKVIEKNKDKFPELYKKGGK